MKSFGGKLHAELYGHRVFNKIMKHATRLRPRIEIMAPNGIVYNKLTLLKERADFSSMQSTIIARTSLGRVLRAKAVDMLAQGGT